MAERVEPPPSGTDSHTLQPLIHNPQLESISETPQPDPLTQQKPGYSYVVQVPKDQIYRVPPPENAVILEQHRNPFPNKKKFRPCGSLCCCVILFVAVLVLALALVASLFSIYLKPKLPNFHVERIDVDSKPSGSYGSAYSQPEYKITLRSENLNTKLDISYKKGGVTWLLYKKNKIASGNYPSFNQKHDNSTVFSVVLRGLKPELSKEIEKSLKREVSLSLMMKVPARTEVVTWNTGRVELEIACQVKVDSLAKGHTRILSGQCHTTSRRT
ncbi:hypothetical protein UlMin_035242 [Ulmus minor]